mgnify:CR=1 FL=1
MLSFPCILALLSLVDSPVPGTEGTAGMTAEQTQLLIWGVLVAAFSVVLNLIGVIFAGIRALRRNPPLHETFATKVELDELAERLDKLDTSIEERLKEIFESLRGINRSLGRVEGIETAIRSSQENTSSRFTEISSRLTEIERSLRK